MELIVDLPSRAWRERWPELQAQVAALLRQVEGAARARRLEPEEVMAVLAEAIAAHPRAGLLRMDGGAVARAYAFSAETTFVLAAWFRRGTVLRLRVLAWRGRARKVPWGRGPRWEVTAPDDVWGRCFPERVQRFLRLRAARTLAQLQRWGLAAPPPQGLAASPGEILRVYIPGRVVLVARRGTDGSRCGGGFLVCPLGWWEIPGAVTPRALAQALGLPRALAGQLLTGRLTWETFLGEMAAQRLTDEEAHRHP